MCCVVICTKCLIRSSDLGMGYPNQANLYRQSKFCRSGSDIFYCHQYPKHLVLGNVSLKSSQMNYTTKMQLEVGNEPYYTCPKHQPLAYILAPFSTISQLRIDRALLLWLQDIGNFLVTFNW